MAKTKNYELESEGSVAQEHPIREGVGAEGYEDEVLRPDDRDSRREIRCGRTC